MLLTSMDVDAADEADFNRWYDREHLLERVAIEGFVEARRYVAHAASPKYLSLYSTATFDVLDSPAYRTALANQTAWSRRNIARFRNMIRGVARVTASHGSGRGAWLGLVRIRPAAGVQEQLRADLVRQFDPNADGVISVHLLENDPLLSKPLTEDAGAASEGAGDWYVLIDGTAPEAVQIAGQFVAAATTGSTLVSTGVYRLLWDLNRAEI